LKRPAYELEIRRAGGGRDKRSKTKCNPSQRIKDRNYVCPQCKTRQSHKTERKKRWSEGIAGEKGAREVAARVMRGADKMQKNEKSHTVKDNCSTNYGKGGGFEGDQGEPM